MANSTFTRRQALTAAAAIIPAAAFAVPAAAITRAAPPARIEELAAELVSCLRQIAPDAVRVQFLLNCTNNRWGMGADEYFEQWEPEPRVKGGQILVERARPIVREGCWRFGEVCS